MNKLCSTQYIQLSEATATIPFNGISCHGEMGLPSTAKLTLNSVEATSPLVVVETALRMICDVDSLTGRFLNEHACIMSREVVSRCRELNMVPQSLTFVKVLKRYFHKRNGGRRNIGG